MKWELEDNKELELKKTKRDFGANDLEITIYNLAPENLREEDRKRLFSGRHLKHREWRFKKDNLFSHYTLRRESLAQIVTEKSARDCVRKHLDATGCRYVYGNRENFVDSFKIEGIYKGKRCIIDFQANPKIKKKGRILRLESNPRFLASKHVSGEEEIVDLVHLITNFSEITELDIKIDTIVWDCPGYWGIRGWYGGSIHPVSSLHYSGEVFREDYNFDFTNIGDNRKTKKQLSLQDVITLYSLQDAEIPKKLKEL